MVFSFFVHSSLPIFHFPVPNQHCTYTRTASTPNALVPDTTSFYFLLCRRTPLLSLLRSLCFLYNPPLRFSPLTPHELTPPSSPCLPFFLNTASSTFDTSPFSTSLSLFIASAPEHKLPH
ncbi:unnamed protein product [Mortierella alpina]